MVRYTYKNITPLYGTLDPIIKEETNTFRSVGLFRMTYTYWDSPSTPQEVVSRHYVCVCVVRWLENLNKGGRFRISTRFKRRTVKEMNPPSPF